MINNFFQNSHNINRNLTGNFPPQIQVEKDIFCIFLNENHTKYFRIYFIYLLPLISQLSLFIDTILFTSILYRLFGSLSCIRGAKTP